MDSKRTDIGCLMNTGETSLVGEEVKMVMGEDDGCLAEIVGVDIKDGYIIMVLKDGAHRGRLLWTKTHNEYRLTRFYNEAV